MRCYSCGRSDGTKKAPDPRGRHGEQVWCADCLKGRQQIADAKGEKP